MSHTPGPWHWSNAYQSSSGQETWSLLDSTGYGILSCDGTANSPQELGERGKFDAALIAAAPAMLEACEWCVALCEEIGATYTNAYASARAAIKAAKGEA